LVKTSRNRKRCRSIPGKVVSSLALVFLFAMVLLPFGTAAASAAPVPTIYSITPFSGYVGTEVILAGADFQASQNDSYVSFGQVRAMEYTSWSDSQIKCKVPEGTWGQVEVTVTTDGGTSNTVTFTAPTHFYFAEGYTGTGFEEWLCLANPGDAETNASITYMFEDGSTSTQDVYIGATTRETVFVNEIVGPDKQVSVKVTSDDPIVVERPMYFGYGGTWAGGHATMGEPLPMSTYYFAEGTCRPGFEPYICVQNPGETAAKVKITYLLGNGDSHEQSINVTASSRSTVRVKDILGEKDDVAHDFSAVVECVSGQGIVAERPMYFNYKGAWPGGHDVMGATSTQTTFYFAEGYTGPGFEEWLCLANPGSTATTAHITFMFEDGSTRNKNISIGATTRETVFVNEEVGTNRQVSVKVTSDDPIIAERPMYFEYKGMWPGGHDVMGAPSPQTTNYCAEGYTGPGFEEWLCLANPGSNATTAHITYMFDDGSTQTKDVNIRATARKTIFVNEEVGPNKQVSVKITSDDPIIAERPMYFDYKGVWPGGHNVMGFTPNGITP
jgi:hypothetical protein